MQVGGMGGRLPTLIEIMWSALYTILLIAVITLPSLTLIIMVKLVDMPYQTTDEYNIVYNITKVPSAVDAVTPSLAVCQPPPFLTSSSVIDSCPPCLFPGQSRSPREGRWYNYSETVSFNASDYSLFYAYSAFYDERPKNPVIRVIAMTTKLEDMMRSVTPDCLLLYPDGRVVRASARTPLPSPIGMGLWMHGRYVREYVYTCRLPSVIDIRPVAVSIRLRKLTRQNEQRTTPPIVKVNVAESGDSMRCFMPVQTPPKPATVRNLAVCVQVAFGDVDPARLVEWFEFQRLLGVELVGVYVGGPAVSSRSMMVFNKYANEGFVDLHFSDYIGPTVWKTNRDNMVDRSWIKTSNQYLLHGSPVINDCVYRHMHSFRYIGVYDFDEVILPRNQTTLVELLADLESMSARQVPNMRPSEFTFRNSYFFLDLTPDANISLNLTTIRYRQKVAISPPGYSVKSIVNPQSCLAMHNHRCWENVNDGFARWQHPLDVKPSIAVSQHYKRCHFGKEECDKLMRNISVDNTSLKYGDRLTEQIRDKLTRISNDVDVSRRKI